MTLCIAARIGVASGHFCAALAVVAMLSGATSAQTSPPASAPAAGAPPPAQTQTPSRSEPVAQMSPPSSPQAQTPAPDTGAAATAPEPVSGPDAGFLLPRDLSPWGMFLSAHIVVKLVIIGLALASVVTWTVALAKGLELALAKRRLRRAHRVLSQAPSLSEAGRLLGERRNLSPLLGAAMTEIRMSVDAADKEGIKERVASRLERIEAHAARLMARGTGVLATIGATAPFVGLFGTVWGIMNSFIGISKQHTTNLAVVAPGIAEALLATALGLFAAIPAVVIYNMFSRSFAGYRALYGDSAAEVLRLTSRDLDRAVSHSAMERWSATLSAAE